MIQCLLCQWNWLQSIIIIIAKFGRLAHKPSKLYIHNCYYTSTNVTHGVRGTRYQQVYSSTHKVHSFTDRVLQLHTMSIVLQTMFAHGIIASGHLLLCVYSGAHMPGRITLGCTLTVSHMGWPAAVSSRRG